MKVYFQIVFAFTWYTSFAFTEARFEILKCVFAVAASKVESGMAMDDSDDGDGDDDYDFNADFK